MSDTQRDREERQHVIKVLQNMVDWMEAINYIVATPERRHALGYAIASIETDLKYDLLYEETSGQKEPSNSEIPTGSIIDWNNCHTSEQLDSISTTKNDLAVDCVSRDSAIKALGYDIKSFKFKSGISKYMDDIAKLLDTTYEIQENNIKALPSVTPQEPRWIPTSERYPKIEDEYKYFLVTDDKGKVSVQEFFISLDEEPQPYFSGMVNVIAWMPLPKAYKGSEE